MAAPGFTINSGAVALASSTTKSILGLISAANVISTICEISVGFDSASTSGKAVVQLCQSTQGAAGTSSTPTPTQIRGKLRTAQCTVASNYTVEPTTLTVAKEWFVDITTSWGWQFPLGREIEPDSSSGTTKAYILRVIPPAQAVNVRSYIEWEE